MTTARTTTGTAGARIERLRQANPAAAELATACALAARVEPALLRALRLLVPEADAAAEADLWFSDLLAGRDTTAMALDPLVAEVLRTELRRPELERLRTAAHETIAAAHGEAHWSVRLEERVYYLDTARPDGADEEIDDLLLAAMERLRSEPNPRGVARWLLGATGRLPRTVSGSLAGRVSAAAAMLHLDRRAPGEGLLSAGESQAWLSWLTTALPTVDVPVQLLDGAVVLGADGPGTVLLPGVPDTDPLVVEVRWTAGRRPRDHIARFRLGDPVQLETGAHKITLVTLAGASFDLAVDDGPGTAPAGLNFDDVKARLRPCLGRDRELREIHEALIRREHFLIAISGRRGSGMSTLLVAAADAARAQGLAVVEHFFGEETDREVVKRSLFAQLAAHYPEELHDASSTDPIEAVRALDRSGALRRRPLVFALDNVNQDASLWAWVRDYLLYASRTLANVRYLVTAVPPLGSEITYIPVLPVRLTRESDAAVCRAMILRDRTRLDPAFAEPWSRREPSVEQLVHELHDLSTGPGVAGTDFRLGRPLQLATGIRGDLHNAEERDQVVECLRRWTKDLPDHLASVALQAFAVEHEPERVTLLQDRVRMISTRLGSNERAVRGWLDEALTAMAAAAAADCAAGGGLAVLADDLPAKLAAIIDWVARQPPASVTMDAIPPVLTVRWPAVRAALRGGLAGTTPTVLDTLRAAHGRNTWQDCTEVPLPGGMTWDVTRQVCAELGIVKPGAQDGLVELVAPDAAEEFLIPGRPGDRLLGLNGADPVEFARTASPTRLAAAVSHALARDDVAEAVTLCLALTVLCRRYAEDVDGLLADLDVTAAAHARQASPSRSQQSFSFALRTAVRELAEEGVPPAGFAPAVRDRLVERSSRVLLVPHGHASIPPLRVSQVIDEQELPTPTSPVVAENVLAIAQMPGSGGAPGGTVFITDNDITTARGRGLASGLHHALGASRGRSGGFVTWTADVVRTDTTPRGVDVDGPVDHAVRLQAGVAVVGKDGSVTVLPRSRSTAQRRFLPGRRACVTTVIELGRDILAASEDGMVRTVPAEGEGARTYTGHRGVVRCLARVSEDTFVSGGADGCLLLWDLDSPAHPIERWQGDAAVTAVAALADGTIVFGTADGQVRTWQPASRAEHRLGSHCAPVGGVEVTGPVVVTWAGSVKFWDVREPGRAIATATGFPGGVRDVILGDRTYTVLCGDRTVRQRELPQFNSGDDDSGRACLAVLGNSVYLGLGRALLRLERNSPPRSIADGGPYLQAAPVGAGIAARSRAAISLFAPSGGWADVRERVGLMAGNQAGRLVTATNRSIAVRASNITESGVSMSIGPSSTETQHSTGDVTSLALSPSGDIVAGLATGETCLFQEDGTERVSTGGPAPVTAVAALPDGPVVSASTDGALRQWSPDSGTEMSARLSPAITAMVVSGDWLITANGAGGLGLWDAASLVQVHTVNLRVPVVALVADLNTVFARDAHGRLWRLDLEQPMTDQSQWQPGATARVDGNQLVLELTDPSMFPGELTAVRALVPRRRLRLSVVGYWPRLAPDGELTVPISLSNGPLTLTAPVDHRPPVVLVTVEFASPLIRGYRATKAFEVPVTESS